MNYWHIQLHPNDREAISKDIVEKILQEKFVIGLDDWDGGQTAIDQFKNEMRIGDIVAVKDGSNPIALVKIKSDYWFEKITDDDFDWFPHRRQIEVLDFYKASYKFSIPQARGTLSICRDLEKATSKAIINWYQMYMANKSIQNSISLLKYKKQIVLQGPPGTGKTRLAKLIATELAKPRMLGNPESIINEFVEHFDANDDKVKALRESKDKLLSTFYGLFPKESLDKLTLEEYCIGKGDRDNFCWWIERGLKPLGYYFPGSARSYLIFWKKELGDYSKYGVVKDIEEDYEAMKKVAGLISEVIQTKNTNNAVQYFGESFLLKLLNTYYPDEFFPINSERMIDNALKIFQVDYQGIDVFEKNKRLNRVYIDKKKQFNSDINSFEFVRFLFDRFNIKTGESIDIKAGIVSEGELELIQFHPAYSYEDFVRGIVAEATESGNVLYHVENKVLADFAQKACDNPNGNYVLIIDEINRANLPSVLGELIYALEYRSKPVTSLYEYEGERKIILPENLYIIGTMNTADRSVGHIDYAIRRRFAFVDVLPDESVIENIIAKNLFKEIESLFSPDFLSPEFKAKDVIIGHSYFIVNNESELKMRLEYEIKPILREYLKDGIFLEKANEKIENLNV